VERLSLAQLGFRLAKPLLHLQDAERAHLLTLQALKALPCGAAVHSGLSTSAFGLNFPSPIGLAAGFDKNAEVPAQMLGLGFGFVEVGTVTPKPQSGNPRPRLFRLSEDEAVINRMGFNNEGHDAVHRRIAHRKRNGIVGVNIGANKDAADRIEDYVEGIRRFSDVADYLTVNISSPNTPGLRGLQSRDELAKLLERLNAERVRQARRAPMLLKIAPDLLDDELTDIASCCIGQVDGVIVSNTTISRPNLRSRFAQEAGGLSGKPLFQLSTQTLAKFYLLTKGAMPLIGVGGISSGERAVEKLLAGASLIQIYSALVFQGPALINDIVSALKQEMQRRSIRSMAQLTGKNAGRIAHQSGTGT
jgi:dihydroorotate dehydrogenase